MTSASIKLTKTKTMSKKIKIESDLKQGTEITVCDYSKLARDGEAIVEVHYNYDVVEKYDIMYYPETWENAQNALNGVAAAWICKVVYHLAPVNETETN